MTVRIQASVDLSVGADAAFASMVDLPSQERWIIATRLFPIEGAVSVPQVGSRLAAFTGVASIGFLDTMVVTAYDPPWRWVTEKDGALLQGVGIMHVEPLPQGCRATWANELELPFGALGRIGWLLIRPIARIGLQASLRRMGTQIARGVLPLAAVPEVQPA